MRLSNALTLATSLFALRGNDPSSSGAGTSSSGSGARVQGNLGNATLALQEYFGSFVVLETPKCTAAFKRIGQRNETEECYPYMVEANMMTVSKPAPNVLDNYIGRYCSSGCNEYSHQLFKEVLGECNLRPSIIKALRPADAAHLILEHIRIQTALTCLRSSDESQYCMVEIVQIFEKAGVDSNTNTIATASDETIVKLLCQTDCGSQVLEVAGNMTDIEVQKLCTADSNGPPAGSVGITLGLYIPTPVISSNLEPSPSTGFEQTSIPAFTETSSASEIPPATSTGIEQPPATPSTTFDTMRKRRIEKRRM